MTAVVLHLNGKQINWKKPHDPTKMVKWSKKGLYGQIIKGSLRTIAHLDRLNALALKRFGVELQVIQPCYNSSVPASAGTHDFDCVLDLWIPGVDPWVQQRFFRANGFGGWYRHAPLFSNHIHGFTLPLGASFATKVGIYVPGQLFDYHAHAFGLSGQHTPGSDKSWFPRNINATVFDLDAYVARKAAA